MWLHEISGTKKKKEKKEFWQTFNDILKIHYNLDAEKE